MGRDFSFLALLIFWVESFFIVEGSLVPCGIFNSLSGFYSLDASSLPSWISDTQKLLQKLPNVLPLGVEGKIGSPTPCWRSTGLDWSICIVFVGVILGWWEHECHPPFCLLILFNFYTLMRMALILEKRSKDQKKKKKKASQSSVKENV